MGLLSRLNLFASIREDGVIFHFDVSVTSGLHHLYYTLLSIREILHILSSVCHL